VNFKANRYYFLVLLPEEEVGLPKDLYDSIIVRLCQKEKYFCQYYWIRSSTELLTILKQLETETRANSNYFPYIHIEAHGDQVNNQQELIVDSYILTPSKIAIPMSVISTHLQAINEACKNNLFVSFSTCFGGNISVSLFEGINIGATKRAPFCGMVAPDKKISADQATKGYSEFFMSLLSDRDVDQAVELLRLYSNHEGGFSYHSCENMFKFLFKDFITLWKSSIEDEQRKSIQTSDLIVSFRAKHNRAITQRELLIFEELQRDPNLIISKFDEMHKHYFMIDLYPENKTRFTTIKEMYTSIINSN